MSEKPGGAYTGGPSTTLVRHIQNLTLTSHHLRYFRTSIYDGWRRLRAPYDYNVLNAAIDKARDAVEDVDQTEGGRR